MLMGIIPDLGCLKLDSSGLMRLGLSANCAVRHFDISTMGTDALEAYMSSKKHSNAAAQSSRGSASKGGMQLHVTSYLWKSYGIFFLGICTNPDNNTVYIIYVSVYTCISFLSTRSNYISNSQLLVQ